MRKNTFTLVIPCLIACALAIIDTDYRNLNSLNVISLGASAIALVAIARYWIRRKDG